MQSFNMIVDGVNKTKIDQIKKITSTFLYRVNINTLLKQFPSVFYFTVFIMTVIIFDPVKKTTPFIIIFHTFYFVKKQRVF